MTDLAQLVQLQYRVAAFLAEQPLDQLLALVEGKASLALIASSDGAQTAVSVAKRAPVVPKTSGAGPTRVPARAARTSPASKPSIDAEAIAAQLRGCESIDEAAELLARLKLLGPAQQDVARALGIVPKGNKAEVARQIINQAVGARIKYNALRQR